MSRDIVYKTKCGLYVKEEAFTVYISKNVYYGGEKHKCIPCKLKQCKNCEGMLFKAYAGVEMCALEQTEEEYLDGKSVNKIIREMNKKFYEEKQKIENGYKCKNIIQHYDKAVKRYNVRECKSIDCMNKVCAITGKKRDIELVNIFYDLKHIEKRGFLVFEEWEKDIKYFEKRVARDIAEKYIPIIKKEEPEKLNLRIQARATKSLEEKLKSLKVNPKLTQKEA